MLVEVSLRRTLSEIRAGARSAGLDRLQQELKSVGHAGSIEVSSAAAYDAARARIYASRYAAAWAQSANGDTAEEAVDAAEVATEARLETLALTETSEAFNAARFAVQVEGSGELVRIWDAINDARTCQFCRDADGTIVGFNDPFPQGEPGSVHPRCACTWSLSTIEETSV